MKSIDVQNELSYRYPEKVTKIFLLPNGLSFPICPKCKSTLEREYMRYCDRCGQCLDWKDYNKAEIVKFKDGIKERE